jgi:hypothetical protein
MSTRAAPPTRRYPNLWIRCQGYARKPVAPEWRPVLARFAECYTLWAALCGVHRNAAVGASSQNRLSEVCHRLFSSKMGMADIGYVGNAPNRWTSVPPEVLKQYGLEQARLDVPGTHV